MGMDLSTSSEIFIKSWR